MLTADEAVNIIYTLFYTRRVVIKVVHEIIGVMAGLASTAQDGAVPDDSAAGRSPLQHGTQCDVSTTVAQS